MDDENSPEYSKYVGLLKKFVTESNAIAQEKAVETTLVFVEYAACAAKWEGNFVLDCYVPVLFIKGMCWCSRWYCDQMLERSTEN